MPKNELPRENFMSQLLHLKKIKDESDLKQEEENSRIAREKENERVGKEQEQKKIEQFSKTCHQEVVPMLKMIARKLSLDNIKIYEHLSTIGTKQAVNWTVTLQWGLGHFETDPDNDTSYRVYPHITIDILMNVKLINPLNKEPIKTYLINNLCEWEPNFYDENRVLISGVTLFDEDWKEKLGQWIVNRLKYELK